MIAVAILYFLKTKIFGQTVEPSTDTARPSIKHLPKHEIENDKIVLIENISNEEIDNILNGFCNIYNKEEFQALPRTYKISNGSYAVTFPFDVNFEIFCYFINYVYYPIGFEKTFNATGWTTTKRHDKWITDQSANKNVMIFIPTTDTEHDNVYITTSDNVGYKLGFAVGEEKQLLNSPNKLYVKPKYQLADLINFEQKNFR